jgi:3-oxoacyl-(acyl-carrier-protein) synthase
VQSGQTGIRKAKHLDSVFADTFLFGEVAYSNAELRDRLLFESKTGLTRTELLAIMAFDEALSRSGIAPEQVSALDTAFISATTVGGMVETEAIHGDANTNKLPSEFVNSYRSGSHTLSIAQLYGIKGYTDTINTACSSSANAIMLGARLIKSGRAKRAIVGGVDSLAKYTVNGFNALQIFSDEMTSPFDEARKGLNLAKERHISYWNARKMRTANP